MSAAYFITGTDTDVGKTTIAAGLLHAARQHDLHVELVDLRNSGDTAGDRQRVVGYGAFTFCTEPHEGKPHVH